MREARIGLVEPIKKTEVTCGPQFSISLSSCGRMVELHNADMSDFKADVMAIASAFQATSVSG